METYVCVLVIIGVISQVINGAYIGDKKTYSSYTYRGKFKGKCASDGLYYRDEKSFVFCSNGNSYVQPCSPGTKNSGYTKYEKGLSYQYRHFCDINLVDEGYGSNYHKRPERVGSSYHYGRNVEHKPRDNSKESIYTVTNKQGYADPYAYTTTQKRQYGQQGYDYGLSDDKNNLYDQGKSGYGNEKTDTGYGHGKNDNEKITNYYTQSADRYSSNYYRYDDNGYGNSYNAGSYNRPYDYSHYSNYNRRY